MAKGGPSFGKHQRKTHTRCRRCGKHSYHISHGVCSACGYGRLRKWREYGWQTATRSGSRRLTPNARVMSR